jgi:predicted metal-dependent enzyme (double-stranded beta helix superfamily)
MDPIEEFVNECLTAVMEDRPMMAVKEVVERVARNRSLEDALTEKPGVRVFHCSDNLTVAQVVIPKGAPRSLPHDHRMWAVIGIARGKEENEFFRRHEKTLVPSGGRVLDEGGVLAMGDDTIHSVGNPLAHSLSSALHVYGGDLVNVERSMWCAPDWHEEPYDAVKVIGAPFEDVSR